MLVGTSYKGFRLTRLEQASIEYDGEAMWRVDGKSIEVSKDRYGLTQWGIEPDGFWGSWNSCILHIDKIAPDVPVKRRQVCDICGYIETSEYMGREMLNLCHTCEYWIKLAKDDCDRVVVNSVHYVIGKPESMSRWSMKGFSGAIWHIRFNDGREMITDNLWYQGQIPLRFMDLFSNNATFINR